MGQTIRNAGLYPDSTTVIKASQKHDDTVNECILNNDIIFVVTQDKKDPSRFIIRSDYCYEGKLEGKVLTFENMDEFKELFPEFYKPANVRLPPNTEQNQETGLPQGLQDTMISIEEIVPTYKNNRLFIKLANIEHVGSIFINNVTDMTNPPQTFGVYISEDGKSFKPNNGHNWFFPENETMLTMNIDKDAMVVMIQAPSKEAMDSISNVILSRTTNLL